MPPGGPSIFPLKSFGLPCCKRLFVMLSVRGGWWSLSRVGLFVTAHGQAPICPQDSPGNNTGWSCHSFSRGTSRSRVKPRCPALQRQCLYRLSHKESPPGGRFFSKNQCPHTHLDWVGKSDYSGIIWSK